MKFEGIPDLAQFYDTLTSFPPHRAVELVNMYFGEMLKECNITLVSDGADAVIIFSVDGDTDKEARIPQSDLLSLVNTVGSIFKQAA